ncbi:MAG: branched-chain amino acid ABC transporter permease [Acidimicrobiales bacterium]
MELFVQRVFDGFSNGAIYAAVAVALVLIFKATTLINFAQGELAMFGTFFAYIFAVQTDLLSFLGDGYMRVWVSAVIAMIFAAALGAFLERTLIRPFDPADHLPVVLITLGLFLIINAIAGVVWNYEPRILPNLFPNDRFFEFFESETNKVGARLWYDSLGVILSLGVMLIVLFLILNKTKMGLAFRAVSSNTESARLVGVRTGRVLMFGWALAAAFGALGGILVAPRLNLSPNMMAPVLIYAFAAAAIGGLDSLGGAAIGGIIVGLIGSLVNGYLSDIEMFEFLRATPLLIPLIALLAVLWFKPSGMFGTSRVERV